MNNASGDVTILLGNGSGGFAPESGSPFAVGAGPGSAVVVDFNGDGIEDLAVTNGGGASVTVLNVGLRVWKHIADAHIWATVEQHDFLALPPFWDQCDREFRTSLVTFGTTSNVCGTVAGSNRPPIAFAGDCTITASQAGNATYAPAPMVIQSFTVNQASQTITFGALSNVASPAFRRLRAITATVSSGHTVSFASNNLTVCTVTGRSVTVVAAGSCSITASQAGKS